MKRNYTDREQVEAVLREALWLAWLAAGGTSGMGFLRDRPEATKDDVWRNATVAGDYGVPTSRQGRLNADYVFGRMLKLRLSYGDDFIEMPDDTPRLDYQSWCRCYTTYDVLLDAAEEAAGGTNNDDEDRGA